MNLEKLNPYGTVQRATIHQMWNWFLQPNSCLSSILASSRNPLGHVQALKKEGIAGPFGCVVIPAVANSPQGRDAVISAMRNLDAPWDDVLDELDAIRISLSTLIRRKMSKMSNGILGIVDRTNWRDSNDLFEIAHDVLNSPNLPDCDRFALIILSRRSRRNFQSALIRRGTEMRKRNQTL